MSRVKYHDISIDLVLPVDHLDYIWDPSSDERSQSPSEHHLQVCWVVVRGPSAPSACNVRCCYRWWNFLVDTAVEVVITSFVVLVLLLLLLLLLSPLLFLSFFRGSAPARVGASHGPPTTLAKTEL